MNINKFKWMKLSNILKWYDEADRLKVSKVARSDKGFLLQYIIAQGNPLKLSKYWVKKRNAFISRTYEAYKLKPTYRRRLSLYMWAFEPEKKYIDIEYK